MVFPVLQFSTLLHKYKDLARKVLEKGKIFCKSQIGTHVPKSVFFVKLQASSFQVSLKQAQSLFAVNYAK